MALQPFHLALSVHDLAKAEEFYGSVLGCSKGRTDKHWIDFNFFGHQLVCHATADGRKRDLPANVVDGKSVPVPHFGVVLAWQDWEALAAKLQAAGQNFIVAPTVRFAGTVGEQATLFLADPSGNMLEFKAMRNPDSLFKS